MRIVALQGRGGTGKTTTLRRLIDIIKNNDRDILGEIADMISDVDLEATGDGNDVRCWFSCKDVKIGITTRGDAKECLHADFFGKSKNFHDRDIVVCAVRTHGGTVSFIEKYGNDGLFIHGRWYLEGNQDTEEKRALTHEIQAKAILANIKEYIEELGALQ